MTVSFDHIPLSILTPGVYVEIDTSRAVQGISALPHTVLLTGQMLAAGSATAGQIYSVGSAGVAKTLFGTGSQLAQMVAAFKRANPLVECFAAGVADAGGGVAATGSIVITGTAIEPGELVCYVGGRRVAIAVASGDAAADVETSGLAAFALETDLPVTVAGDAAAGFDFTAIPKGSIGNQIMLGVCLADGEHVPAGLSVTVTAMSAGATDPDYSAVITAMGEDWYNTVVAGLVDTTNIGLFVTELEDRFGPLRQIEGSLFGAKYDTRANLTTLGNSYNSAMFVLVGAEASATLPLPWELAALVAGEDSANAQVDPARACTGLILPGARAAARGSRFTRAERDILLSDGVSTVVATRDGRLAIERLVTTYQTNALSVPDTSLQDQQTLRLFAAIRYSARVRISTRFARFKLTDDGNPIPPGQPITSPSDIKAELVSLGREWVATGWMENLSQFVEELYVERDPSDPNRVNAVLPPDFVNNLLIAAMKVSFRK